jgi:PRTRC genetic system protein B
MIQIGDVEISAGGWGNRELKQSIDWALVMSRVGNARILTHHKIISKQGKAAILRGQPVDREIALQLLEAFREQPDPAEGWIPTDLLYRSEQAIAWFVRRKHRPLHCKPEGGKGITLRVPWPGLVFIARRDRSLSVYAVTGFPRPNTPLYHAPLANIYADGSLCWGDITPPAFSMRSIPQWESCIFNTWFTAPNHDRVLRLPAGAAADRSNLGARWLRCWRGLHSAKAKDFPERDLILTGLTLEKALVA